MKAMSVAVNPVFRRRLTAEGAALGQRTGVHRPRASGSDPGARDTLCDDHPWQALAERQLQRNAATRMPGR